MTKSISKFEYIAAAAILAGLVLPQIAMAKGKGNHRGGNRSQQVRRASFNHRNNQHGNSQNNMRRRQTNENQNRKFAISQGHGRQNEFKRRAVQNKKSQDHRTGANLMARVRRSQHDAHRGNFRHNERHGGWNRNWNWHHNWNRNRHWTGYGPTYYGINYWSHRRCWTPPVYYPTQTVVVSQPAQATEPAIVTPEPAAGYADLVLEDLQYAEAATLLVGPAYRVKFRNQGTESVSKFRIGLLAAASDQPGEDSPRTVVEVAGLAPGQASEVTVRLPQTAMKLVGGNGQTAFTHLFVAIDIDSVVNESDKENNAAVVERAQLEVAAR